MFTTVPLTIDTSDYGDSCYGKGTAVKVQTLTAFRSHETKLLKEYLSSHRTDPDYKPMYNTIGATNITIADDHLIVQEKTLLNVFGRIQYQGQDAYVNFYLQQKLNGKLRGYVKYGKDLYLRPILITKSDKVRSASDILGIAGFQLLSRNNEQHNCLEPIMVRGVRHAKKII